MLMLASLLAKSLFMLCDTPVHVYNVYAWCSPRVRVCVCIITSMKISGSMQNSEPHV